MRMTATAAAWTEMMPREQGAAEDGDIGSRLDQAGAAEHFVGLQMLRQDRIFDRAEEGRVDAHREQGEQQQRHRDRADRDSRHAIQRPAAPTSMIRISQNLTIRMIRALSRASASWPDSADSRKKGRMKTPVVIALNHVSERSSL